MTRHECAEMLRSALHARERMAQKEVELVGSDGEVVGVHKIPFDKDELYQAIKYALEIVEKEA